MDNNNRKNQDYIDLRDGFAQSYPPQHVPPAHVPPPKAKFPFAPKNSNTFVLILILANIFLQFMLGIAIGIMMILDPGFSPADFFPAWGQILYIQILVLGVPSAIYLIIKRKHIKEILPFRRLGWRNVLMIIGLSLLMQPVLMLINSVSQLVFPNVISDVMLDMLAEGGILLSLAVFAMIPPITEEIAFRGIGFAGFRHVKIGTAAIING
ncbi:MAG: hypothetical protein LBE55_01605, partial [Clostridiales bacterium]|nr:hypothetical protein [Clostridiales bacterium]